MSDSGILAERRASVLSQLVLLFAQGRDPVGLAEDAVDLVATATGASAVFVYLWDEDEERLILRVATPGRQQNGIGEIRLRLGEGIAGWAAMRQTSVIIDHTPRDDPRFVAIDEIDEDEFHSVLAAPIADGLNQLRGVFALYSESSAAFGEDELAISVEVGRLLATGLVRAETVADLDRQSAIAHFLSDFPTAARTSLSPCLQFAAPRLLDLLDADVCVLEHLDRTGGGAAPITVATRSSGSPHRVWSTHSRAAAQATIDQSTEGLEHASVTLQMGGSRGILSSYRRTRFRPRDFDRMSTLATQLGVLLEAIELNSLGSSLATRLRFTQDDDDAARLLRDLSVDGPTCPVLVRVDGLRGDWEVASRDLRNVLTSAAGPRSIVLLHSTWAMVLLDTPTGRIPADLAAHLLSATQHLSRELGLRASIGIGTVAHDPGQIRQAIQHAQHALDWAQGYGRDAAVALTSYADVRDVLPLSEVMSAMTPKVVSLIRSIEPLVRYDVDQGSQLVRTLSVLAGFGGSVNETAVELVIHRNTLRQRMQRIEQVLGMSLDPSTDWPALSLATRTALIRVEQARVEASGSRQ